MQTNLNLPIEQLTSEYLANIKVICFDGDGVTKQKGTEFLFENGQLVLESYPPRIDFLEKLNKLKKRFHITISSGRSMSYLMNAYGERVDSLQAEIGMYLYNGKLLTSNFQLTTEQKNKIEKIRQELGRLSDVNIRGFEPKEYLITLHTIKAIPEVDEIVKRNDLEGELYCWWNEEAYDIGLKTINKATGLQKLVERLGLKMENVMTVGNGINDENMTAVAAVDVSTDAKHLSADFIAVGEDGGGEVVVDKLLSLVLTS
ncbi:HAD family phosphatase [Candidatus Shapirobacteria bacterium]|nr:HAD family phosphatase [Candidatus Shapirobacteria bacterium]